MNNNSDKKTISLSAAVSVFLHTVIVLIFVFIRFETGPIETQKTELFFLRMVDEKPAPEKQSEETQPRTESSPAKDTVRKPRAIDTADIFEPDITIPVDIPARTEPQISPETLLRQEKKHEVFTPLANGKPIPLPTRTEALSPFQRGETLFPGTPIELKPSGSADDKHLTVPPEKVSDERRRFSGEIMGVKMDGPLLLVPGAIHFARSVKWGFRDLFSRRNLKLIREKRFAGITEKDVRFLILIWRDGLLDPQKLSPHDRLFLSKSRGEKIQTNKACLERMSIRGLTTSLMVNGHVVFRTNVSRDEMLSVLSMETADTEKQIENEMCLRYIELIATCYDTGKKTAVIPE